MSDNESPDKKDRPLPGAWDRNPYEAPTAHVRDVKTPIDDTLAAEPNKVAAGRGVAWWKEGWGLFREAPGLWIGICVVLMLINIAMPLVPIIGGLATSLLFPVFGAGLILGCRSLESDETLAFGHLFAGFQNNFGRLLAVGALYLLGLIIIFIPVGFGIGFFAGTAGGGDAGLLFAILVGALLAIPLFMSIWFAPALVALHDLTAFEAMKLSFRACLRNLLPFLIYGLALIVLAVLATLPIGLGWLLLMPVAVCSLYASYRDIFTGGH
ncbi:MAG: hypothetical protein LBT71_08075 [Azoarcus sp.]|jgi:hypothetical protein|nr:hypothetical protein [Azoarcus sp.]